MQVKVDQRREIGKLARQLFPDGILNKILADIAA